jgi:hypothetical protein
MGRASLESVGRKTESSSLRVSLDQAIEIHAMVLKCRFGKRAPPLAREKANTCLASGDYEGHSVWRGVATVAVALLRGGTRGQ